MFFKKSNNAPQANDNVVSLTKTAAISLEKKGLSQLKAAVYLVLDHSGSMQPYYTTGVVQHLAEQALGLSANLDDDGVVPVVFFHNAAYKAMDLVIGQHQGGIHRLEREGRVEWGGTNYAPAMRSVLNHYKASGATDPAFVIFQTDGACFDQADTTDLLCLTSGMPIFWQFVGFGPKDSNEFAFLRGLSDLPNRIVDNAGFCATGYYPKQLSDSELYDMLLNEFPQWLVAARQAGIVR